MPSACPETKKSTSPQIMPNTPANTEKAILQAKIQSLLGLHPKLVDLSLERIQRLLAKLGNPHHHLPPVIHIAGTNGKGSAVAFARAFLEAAGYSTHVYTSPHLVDWHERYRLGGKKNGKITSAYVSDKVLAQILAEVSRTNDNQPITIFEILTTVAFVLFARFPADATLLEVGLGGRYDATNIIPCPAAALIQPIGLDHQDFLGQTIAQIAAEKAGIIKPDCPVVLGFQPEKTAQKVLAQAAFQAHAPLIIYGRDYDAKQQGENWLFDNGKYVLKLPKPQLQGTFQISNAAAALAAVLAAGFKISPAAAAKAMTTVYWPARMQPLTHGALWKQIPNGADLWLDGGHNPAAAKVLAENLRPYVMKRPFYILYAMLKNKDAGHYLQEFLPFNPKIYAVPINSSDQGISPTKLVQTAQMLGLTAKTAESLSAALTQIKAEKTKHQYPPFILISGSLYLASDALIQNGTPPNEY